MFLLYTSFFHFAFVYYLKRREWKVNRLMRPFSSAKKYKAWILLIILDATFSFSFGFVLCIWREWENRCVLHHQYETNAVTLLLYVQKLQNEKSNALASCACAVSRRVAHLTMRKTCWMHVSISISMYFCFYVMFCITLCILGAFVLYRICFWIVIYVHVRLLSISLLPITLCLLPFNLSNFYSHFRSFSACVPDERFGLIIQIKCYTNYSPGIGNKHSIGNGWDLICWCCCCCCCVFLFFCYFQE